MQGSQNKKIKSIAIAVAIIFGIVALSFGLSKYVFNVNTPDKPIRFQRIQN